MRGNKHSATRVITTGLRSSLTRKASAFAMAVSLCFPSVATAEWWDVFEFVGRINPGPFRGWVVSCRSTLPWRAEGGVSGLCNDSFGVGVTITDPTPKVHEWLALTYANRFGPRTGHRANSRDDADIVTWQGLEVGIETNRWLLSRMPTGNSRYLRWISGLSAATNQFSGDSFSTFYEPALRVTPIAMIWPNLVGDLGPALPKWLRRFGVEAAYNFSVVAVDPERFRLKSHPGFDGSREVIQGFRWQLLWSLSLDD